MTQWNYGYGGKNEPEHLGQEKVKSQLRRCHRYQLAYKTETYFYSVKFPTLLYVRHQTLPSDEVGLPPTVPETAAVPSAATRRG